MKDPLRQFSHALAAAALLLSLFCANVVAQRNPPMASQQRDAEKEDLFTRFLGEKNVPSAEHLRQAYEVAKQFLARFGDDNDHYAHDVRRFVVEYERAMHELEVSKAYGAGDYAKTFELGRSLLQLDAANFVALGTLAKAGFDNSVAGNTSLNAETIDCAKRAIELLDAGKVARPAPFEDLEIARGFLNVVVGTLLRDRSPEEAAIAFRNAVLSDSPYRKDPLTYYRLGIAILKGEFERLASEYNKRYGNTSPSPEQRAMLEKLNQVGERAIDAYARAVALSTSQEQQEARTKILEQLTALYKNFHEGSDVGLNELIAGVLAKPMP